ncbi:helix-turn-helix domain-containing protein [Streptomyces sp. NPDC057540]|uniref:helix-turn-helix domain-containing protein n=1 Tax=Streptomyces sp. NPDC057540 TaxID=3346160 RepID=UPI00368118F2
MPAAHMRQPDRDAPVVPMQDGGDRLSDRMLGDELRAHRERRGYTLADAARVIRGSTSKISRMERGQSPVKYRDLNDLALFYGVSREDRVLLEQLYQQTSNEDLFARFADVTPNYLKRLIRLERSAKWITVYESRVIPGLLQTEDYARALTRMIELERSDNEIELIVGLRKQRQLMLGQRRPNFVALIWEKVLYQPYGSASMMAEQMRFLRQAHATKNVSVRVLPDWYMAPPTSVYHMTFEEGQSQELAYSEHADGANYITNKPQLDRTRKLLTNLRANVHKGKKNTEALERAVAHWEGLAAEQPG